MFSLFSKKYMDEEAAKVFWSWFEEQEVWIIDCIAKSDAAFVWAIDERLKPVFPYFRGELEFQLGYNEGVGEFFFFHFGQPSFCIWLLPKHILREGMINHKKRGVTAMIRFVSLLFYKYQHLYRQEYKQKSCCIRLRTYDKEECSNPIQGQRKSTLVSHPECFLAVLQSQRQDSHCNNSHYNNKISKS